MLARPSACAGSLSSVVKGRHLPTDFHKTGQTVGAARRCSEAGPGAGPCCLLLPSTASRCLCCWSPPGPRLALLCPGMVLRLRGERKAEQRHAPTPAPEISTGSEGPVLGTGCVLSLPHGQDRSGRGWSRRGRRALQNVAPPRGHVHVIL